MMQRMAAEAIRRIGLLIVALLLLAIAVLFACAAMTAGLSAYMPLWAALAITAATLLLICLLLLLLAGRGAGSQRGAPSARDAQVAAIGAALGDSMRTRPKSTLLLALGAGIVLGLNPSLRRDLIDLLRAPPPR